MVLVEYLYVTRIELDTDNLRQWLSIKARTRSTICWRTIPRRQIRWMGFVELDIESLAAGCYGRAFATHRLRHLT